MFKLKHTNKITKGVIAATALAIGSIVSPAAHADVFTVDDFLFSITLGSSSDAMEIGALRDFLDDPTLNIALKEDREDAVFGQDDAGNWFIDVAPAQPGYFMLKFGDGGTDFDSHYFFENVDELTKLVWTDAQVDFLTGGCGDGTCNIERLSHYLITEDTDVPSNEIPEPGSVALAGLGMLGLWLGRRRMKK